MSLIEAIIHERNRLIILLLNKKIFFSILLIFFLIQSDSDTHYYHVDTTLQKLTPISESTYITQETNKPIVIKKELTKLMTHQFCIPSPQKNNIQSFETSFKEWSVAINHITFVEITYFCKKNSVSLLFDQEIIVEKIVIWCQEQNIASDNILKNRYYADNNIENEEYVLITFFNFL